MTSESLGILFGKAINIAFWSTVVTVASIGFVSFVSWTPPVPEELNPLMVRLVWGLSFLVGVIASLVAESEGEE